MHIERDLWRNLFEDMLMSGTGVAATRDRKWYNPLRWILGKRYWKRVKPVDYFRGEYD